MTACPETLSPAVVATSVAISNKNSCGAARLDGTYLECPADKQANEAFDRMTQLTVDEIDKKLLCSIMCCCRDDPASSSSGKSDLYQECVKQTLDAADKSLGGHSRYKAEISYDMIRDAYIEIAGSPRKVQLLKETEDCNCTDGEPEPGPVPVPVEEKQKDKAGYEKYSNSNSRTAGAT